MRVTVSVLVSWQIHYRKESAIEEQW